MDVEGFNHFDIPERPVYVGTSSILLGLPTMGKKCVVKNTKTNTAKNNDFPCILCMLYIIFY